MKTRKITSIVLSVVTAASMVIGSMPLSQTTLASAAGKTTLSVSKMTLAVGGVKILKLKNNKKKTTWRIIAGKKYIRLKNEEKNSVKIAGIKAGAAKVQVKAGKAKYACKVIVKAKVNSDASEQTTLAPQVIVPVQDAPVVSVNPTITEQSVTQAPQSTEGKASETPAESIQPADEIPTKIPLISEKPAVTKIPLVHETEKPAVTPSATTEPEKVQYEKHLGEKVDVADLMKDAKYDRKGYIQLTDVKSAQDDIDDVTITKSGHVWIMCGDHRIKDVGESLSCYFQNKNVKYELIYSDESFYSGMQGDAAGYYSVRAVYQAPDGNNYYRNYYVIKQVYTFVHIDCTVNDTEISEKDLKIREKAEENDNFNYRDEKVTKDIYGTSYKLLEMGKEYRIFVPFDVFGAGNDIELGEYKADTIKKETLSYDKKYTKVEKSEEDVTALRNMIQNLRAEGAVVDEDINNRKYYWWRNGRLVSIFWQSDKSNIQTDKLSFAEFDDLTELRIAYNSIKQLDVSENLKLQILSCGDCELQELCFGNNKELYTLSCRYNKLKELDVSQCSLLTDLDCSNNQLTELELSQNTKLLDLDCWYNRLNKLDVSNNLKLKRLYCGYNFIKELDVDQNSDLEILNCEKNLLSALSIEQNKKLISIYCGENRLSSLEVKNQPNLQKLECDSNLLTKLDVSNNTELEELLCGENRLSDLNIAANVKMKMLWCQNNLLTTLVMNENMVSLRCNNNCLKKLELQTIENLEELDCSDNLLSELDIRQNKKLDSGYLKTDANVRVIRKNGELLPTQTPVNTPIESEKPTATPTPSGSIDSYGRNVEEVAALTKIIKEQKKQGATVSEDLSSSEYVWRKVNEEEGARLTQIYWNNKKLSGELSLEAFSYLNIVECTDNRLSRLDVSNNKVLNRLGCENNKLIEININNNSKLSYLDCENNLIIHLDTSNNNELKTIICNGNKLAELALEYNGNLQYLECADNNFTNLDVSNAADLIELYCNINRLSELDVSNNVKLEYLRCSINNIKVLDISKNVELSELECNESVEVIGQENTKVDTIKWYN